MLEAEQELNANKEESLDFRYLRDVYLWVSSPHSHRPRSDENSHLLRHLCYWLVPPFAYRRVDETRAEGYMEWWKVHSPRTHVMYQLADKKNQQYDVASKRLAEREKQQKKIRDG
jgi:hypothetical protein